MRAVHSALALAVFIALALLSAPATAHGVRTGSLRIDEVAPTRALVRWSLPAGGAASGAASSAGAGPVLPADCTSTPDEELSGEGREAFTLECPTGLAGRTFAVRGLGPIVAEATVFVRFADGREASHLLGAREPTWTIPRAEAALEVLGSYVRSGLLHIAGGADHLLFLALLVLVLRRAKAVLLAETAFTVSHSLAYAATALGWIHVRPAPVEACIALSLVLLALDVRKEASSRSPWHGAAVALVFGLVHGLGFAGGLREAGLPDGHAAVALVGFGAGIEIGQVAFLVLVLSLVAALSRTRAFPRAIEVATVISGGVSTAWLVERLVTCFTA